MLWESVAAADGSSNARRDLVNGERNASHAGLYYQPRQNWPSTVVTGRLSEVDTAGSQTGAIGGVRTALRADRKHDRLTRDRDGRSLSTSVADTLALEPAPSLKCPPV